MKTLKQFLKEKELPTLYVDIDGVFADWQGGVDKILEKYGYPKWDDRSWIEQYDSHQRDQIRWAILNKQKSVYKDLSVLKEGKKIWKFVKAYNPNILSAISDKYDFEIGSNEKKIWLEEKFGINNFNNIYFVKSNTKHKFALDENGRPNLLIDDFSVNCKKFVESGGLAIHHVSSEQTICELKKMGFKKR